MILSEQTINVSLKQTLEQIHAARCYTLEFLQDLSPEDWFAMPGGVSHIAWQVGHLATAEYRLCLDRIRGERAEDGRLVSLAMLTLFGRGSIPIAGAEKYPPISDIQASLERVHKATMTECARLGDDDLSVAPLRPHKHFKTKLGSLQWCSRHEMAHAGQIALLRRLIGKPPLW